MLKSLTTVKEGLEDMSGNFLPQHKTWLKDGFTWAIHRGGRGVCSWANYILGTDSRLFQNVVVRDARHNTYHYLVLECLRRSETAAHSLYLGKCTLFPIRPPKTPDKLDRMFAKIRGSIPKPPWRERHRKVWISPDTWSLIDTRVAARRQGDQRNARAFACAIAISTPGGQAQTGG